MKDSVSKLEDGLIELLSVLEPEPKFIPHFEETHSSLFEACRVIAKELDITISEPQKIEELASPLEYLEAISKASNFRIRPERLTPFWWKNDCGPLLAFNQADGKPIALIQKKGKYHIVDEKGGREEILTREKAKHLNTTAFRFYKSFQFEKIEFLYLFKFIFKDLQIDFRTIILLQILVGLLALLFPIIIGLIFDGLIPNADLTHLKQAILALIVVVMMSGLFGLVEGIALLRCRLKSTVNIQAAVWDRLLRLPISFFKKYAAGDLSLRARMIDSIQNFVTDSYLQGILTGTFSLFSLFLMFYYDVILATVATIMAIIAAFITIGFSFIQIKYQRPLLELQAKITSLLYQLLLSIHKIRISNKEETAFSLWAKSFSSKTKLQLKALTNLMWFRIIDPFFMTATTVLIFLFVVKETNLSLGYFIAFFAAFTQFFSSGLAMAEIVTRAIQIVPLYERIKPILEALPEIEDQGIEFDELKEEIHLKNIYFQYAKELPLTLKQISILIPKGSFVGITGPTGSGKSTLMRLLVKFEQPHKGEILLDGNELSLYEIQSVRSMMGVVLQNSTLIPGSLYENITGLKTALTMEDAWWAAEFTQIANEIREMPMGMHTFITEGGSNISVGQKQRIMLARAIVNKPQILLLDEATNALDSKTESIIFNNLSKIKITRVVASHRLNSLRYADMIYVLDHGKVVQQGRYEELLAQPGLFMELSKSQNR